jgi:N-methylhydantoinase B
LNQHRSLPDYVRPHNVDKITLDIIQHALENIRYEMDRVLMTTAISPTIREQSDEFPLIADRQGRMVVGQFGSAINAILSNSPYQVSDLHDGDVLIVNDPYMMEGSTSHLKDVLLLRPIFYEDDLVGYASQWGDMVDVGGKTPGSLPVDATTIYEEGIRIPPIKLYAGGRLNNDVMYMLSHNSRLPKVLEADIKALAASTMVGGNRVKELCQRFGKETYLEALDAILDRTRTGVIELIRQNLPDGQRFEFEDFTDDDGLGHGPIKLHLAMYRERDELNFDWTGTDPQVPGPVNFYLNPDMFKMFAGIFLIMAFAPTLVFNDGYYDVINVVIPEGSVLRPRFPASLSNRLVLMARHFDVLQAVFSKALSNFSVSGSYGTSPNFVYSPKVTGNSDPRTAPIMYEILYGGIPARTGADGLDGHSWWPEFYSAPTEYLEKHYPVRVESYEVRKDSGGPGKYRGGAGVRKVYRFLADGDIMFQDDRAYTYPYGVDGGCHGAASGKTLVRISGEEIPLPSKVQNVPVNIGDLLVFDTAGAGGLGDPLDRDPQRVLQDVLRNLVSMDQAHQMYGVVIKNGQVSVDETEALRGVKRAERSELGKFDNGPIPSVDDLRKKIAEDREAFNGWINTQVRNF